MCVAMLRQKVVSLRSPEVALVLASRFKFSLESLLGATWDKTVHLDSFLTREPLCVLDLVVCPLLHLVLEPGREPRHASLIGTWAVIEEKTGGCGCGGGRCLFLFSNVCFQDFKAAGLTVSPSIVNAVVGCVRKVTISIAADLGDRFPISIGPLPVVLWSLLSPDAAD